MHPPGLTFPRPFRRSQQHEPSNSSPNAAVIATNSDATLSKASCVRAGYYQDDFLRHFVVGDAREFFLDLDLDLLFFFSSEEAPADQPRCVALC